jgi:hypothetical protein
VTSTKKFTAKANKFFMSNPFCFSFLLRLRTFGSIRLCGSEFFSGVSHRFDTPLRLSLRTAAFFGASTMPLLFAQHAVACYWVCVPFGVSFFPFFFLLRLLRLCGSEFFSGVSHRFPVVSVTILTSISFFFLLPLCGSES